MADYLDVVYNKAQKPDTSYPSQLIEFLVNKYQMKNGQTLLETGCGTGNFLRCFADHGLQINGCDISPRAGSDLEGIKVLKCDLEKGPLPYADNLFDVIYSKSLIEHLTPSSPYLSEVFRILKPGGLCLTLTPDWESNYKIFYDDPTHISPFTRVSLQRVYEMSGYTNVKIELLRQLPVVWKYPTLKYLCAALAPLTPVRTKNKFLRWGRELMLLGSGYKPNR